MYVYYNKKIAFVILNTHLLQHYTSITGAIKICQNMTFLPYLHDIYIDSKRDSNADRGHICYELRVHVLLISSDLSQRHE